MVRPSVLSLFTGAGGIDLGLEAAGFETVCAVEKDSISRETLALNRPDWAQSAAGDVFDFATGLKPSDLGMKSGELDLLAGGPPCQPFSKAAQWQDEGRRGTADTRASCIDAIVDIAETLRPKLILVENVPGFVRRDKSGFDRLKRKLFDVGERTGLRYSLSAAVLQAEEYGVPQTRERAFVVGVRADIAAEFKWPSPLAVADHRRAGDALAGITVLDKPIASGRWANLLPSVPAGDNYMFHTPGAGGLPLFGARTRFWSFLLKLHPNRPAWTLPASAGPATGPFHWDNRPLAVAEMARLQTFPLHWKFTGSRHAAVRQAGNAAPPLLVEHVGRKLTSLLGASVPKELTHVLPRLEELPRPPRRRAVADEFLSYLGKHCAHGGTGKGPRPRSMSVG